MKKPNRIIKKNNILHYPLLPSLFILLCFR